LFGSLAIQGKDGGKEGKQASAKQLNYALGSQKLEKEAADFFRGFFALGTCLCFEIGLLVVQLRQNKCFLQL
jgi:hypothetical protein